MFKCIKVVDYYAVKFGQQDSISEKVGITSYMYRICTSYKFSIFALQTGYPREVGSTTGTIIIV
jgi:hypothetical protein